MSTADDALEDSNDDLSGSGRGRGRDVTGRLGQLVVRQRPLRSMVRGGLQDFAVDADASAPLREREHVDRKIPRMLFIAGHERREIVGPKRGAGGVSTIYTLCSDRRVRPKESFYL